ncbi:MAG: hypothetical protein ACI97A_000305 [Planctomycetota bacterium]|jgi:hypothetical protein
MLMSAHRILVSHCSQEISTEIEFTRTGMLCLERRLWVKREQMRGAGKRKLLGLALFPVSFITP